MYTTSACQLRYRYVVLDDIYSNDVYSFQINMVQIMSVLLRLKNTGLRKIMKMH